MFHVIPAPFHWELTASPLLSLKEAEKRGIAIELIRNGSRGLFWLEPLVEVVTRRRSHGLWPGTGQ